MNAHVNGSDAQLSNDAVAAELLDELANRLQAGEPVEALLATHPEHADRLRRLLPAAALLAELDESGQPPAGDLTAEPVAGVLGDFRLIREVGRGGMGIVYEAEQISLGRRVALKMLPFAATMDPRQLQRFHNEARAAAGLHHTNIVPVYGVGCERGVHYYAMQFIDGRTLAEFIAEQVKSTLPDGGPATACAPTVPQAAQATSVAPRDRSYFRRVAEWGIQAAEALDCAHTLGVVHRDIKPANLLVDAAARLWVTDFGLAQVQSDSRLTMTGDLIGTLRYMSPEQALAKRMAIDHRTDVYSLGATLFELLTVQPVFSGTDRQELLRQIAFEEPQPPRRINRAIPDEMETIVLKALEKNPAERYATAQELADDLGRFLEDRAILARRPDLSRRIGRWLRRHRALVASAAVCLFVAVAALATSTVLIWQKERATDAAYHDAEEQRLEAVDQRRVAKEQRQEAIANLQDAHAAVDQFLDRLGTDRLAAVEPWRRPLLKDALRFYEKFLQRTNVDDELRLDAARSYINAGYARLYLGEPVQAVQSVRKGIAMAKELAARDPGHPEHQHVLARGWGTLGLARRWMNHLDEAADALKTARDLELRLVADHPDSRAYRKQLAGICVNLGIVHAERHSPKAEEFFRESLRWGKELADAVPEETDYQQILVAAQLDLGILLGYRAGDKEGDKLLSEAAVVQEKIVRKEGGPEARATLAKVYSAKMRLQMSRGQIQQAVPAGKRALDLWHELTEMFPNVPDYAQGCGEAQYDAAKLLARTGRDSGALDFYGQAEAVYAELAKSFPDKREYRERLAECCFQRGWLLTASGDPKVRKPAAAIEPAQKAVALFPENGRYRAALGVAYYWNQKFKKALKELSVANKDPQTDERIDLYFLAMTQWRLGNKQEALKWYGAAEAWRKQHPSKLAIITQLSRLAAEVLHIKVMPPPQPKDPVSRRSAVDRAAK